MLITCQLALGSNILTFHDFWGKYNFCVISSCDTLSAGLTAYLISDKTHKHLTAAARRAEAVTHHTPSRSGWIRWEGNRWNIAVANYVVLVVLPSRVLNLPFHQVRGKHWRKSCWKRSHVPIGQVIKQCPLYSLKTVSSISLQQILLRTWHTVWTLEISSKHGWMITHKLDHKRRWF